MRAYGFLILVQFIAWSFQTIIGVDRPSGTMYSRNHIGYFIIPYLYLSLLYYEDKFKPALSVFYSFMLGGLGAIVAIISSFTKYLLDRSLVKTLKMSIIIIPIFVLMTYLFLSHRIVEQVESFGEIPDRVENFDSGHSGSFTWRVVTWYYLINEVIDHDAYIFGMGLDTTSTGANLFGLEPHNDYVKVFTEFGLVGLTLFLLMIFHHLKFLNRKRKTNRLVQPLYYSFLGLIIGMLVGNILVHASLWWFYFGILGISLNKKINN